MANKSPPHSRKSHHFVIPSETHRHLGLISQMKTAGGLRKWPCAPHKKRPRQIHRPGSPAGLSMINENYTFTTLVAWGPFAPSVISNSTFWPSAKDLNPSP